MQEKESFSFINEKIKEKPLNKKRIVFRAVFCVAMAVVFGVVAALVFTLVQPRFEELLYTQEPPLVSIPRDDV